MKKYMKIQAIQGLIFGLRQDIYSLQEMEEIPQDEYEKLVNQYFEAIKELTYETPFN